jgi:hypothetical protein
MPFLSTVGATIDAVARIIKLIISRKGETFTEGPERDAMTPDKKLSAVENFVMKSTRCVNNATPAATSSRVAPTI